MTGMGPEFIAMPPMLSAGRPAVVVRRK